MLRYYQDHNGEQRAVFHIPAGVLSELGLERLIQLAGTSFTIGHLSGDWRSNQPGIRIWVTREGDGVTITAEAESTAENVMSRHTINSLLLGALGKSIAG